MFTNANKLEEAEKEEEKEEEEGEEEEGEVHWQHKQSASGNPRTLNMGALKSDKNTAEVCTPLHCCL